MNIINPRKLFRNNLSLAVCVCDARCRQNGDKSNECKDTFFPKKNVRSSNWKKVWTPFVRNRVRLLQSITIIIKKELNDDLKACGNYDDCFRWAKFLTFHFIINKRKVLLCCAVFCCCCCRARALLAVTQTHAHGVEKRRATVKCVQSVNYAILQSTSYWSHRWKCRLFSFISGFVFADTHYLTTYHTFCAFFHHIDVFFFSFRSSFLSLFLSRIQCKYSVCVCVDKTISLSSTEVKRMKKKINMNFSTELK